MQPLSSSSMLASRCRKFSQSPSASPAVHTVRARTEPKRPAPFTYLQIHAQVVHFVPFQSVLLPRRASIFSMAEWARLSCYGTPFACRFALLVQSVKATAFICRCFRAVSYLGKNRSPCSSPTRLRTQSSSRTPYSEVSGRSTASIPYWESLKVIAFDKTTVNRNLSSGIPLPYIPR